RVSPAAPDPLPLVVQATSLLLLNAETTERTILAGTRIARVLGRRATVIPRWDELIVRIEDGQGSSAQIALVAPVAVDMHKVLETERVVDAISKGEVSPEEGRSAFARISALPPVTLVRFVLAAAVGACALAVVWGASRPSTLPLIAFSAGAGALLRRGLSRAIPTFLVQPFGAALIAGLVGGLAQRFQLDSALALIAVCPCMVLVPGPHLLNGFIDLARARIALGCARLAFAGVVILAISAGLLLGLSLVGANLPVSPPSRSIPLPLDVVAAALAVFAFASFYSMPWRYLPIPMVVGACAHGLRWSLLALGTSAEAAAFVACILVGLVVTLLAPRLRQPFSALSFASVVTLIPSVFVFRMAAGLVELARVGETVHPGLASTVLSNGATATLILLAMGFGLILPKLCVDRFHDG
ncbi:MAG TPA: threonine/serine exporter family protein, partial [Myxococcaceae bacterium]|nr:threonine/serine exporter family protein [Myxococcaceae bacterium]